MKLTLRFGFDFDEDLREDFGPSNSLWRFLNLDGSKELDHEIRLCKNEFLTLRWKVGVYT